MAATKLGFTRSSDPLAYETYEQLKKLGEKEFDVGSPVVAFQKTGKAPQIRGKGDGVIEGEEVRRRALELLSQKPGDQRLQRIVEKFSIGAIVWMLDNGTKAKVAEAIRLLESDLGGKGVAQMSDGERKRFAYGLFGFAMMTKHPNTPSVPGILQERFRDCGLDRLADYLAKNGGLGLSDIRGDSPVELPASYVLQHMLGACTELSKVLYGVFEQAGLKPFFAQSTIPGLATALERSKLIPSAAEFSSDNASHTFVGLSFQDGFKYYDPLYSDYRFEFGDVAHLELINYLSVDLTNTGESLFHAGKTEMAEDFLQRALQADPRMPTTRVALSFVAIMSGNWAEAELHARAAVKVAPDFSRALHALSIALKRQKKYAEALSNATKAAAAEPSNRVIVKNKQDLTELVRQGR